MRERTRARPGARRRDRHGDVVRAEATSAARRGAARCCRRPTARSGHVVHSRRASLRRRDEARRRAARARATANALAVPTRAVDAARRWSRIRDFTRLGGAAPTLWIRGGADRAARSASRGAAGSRRGPGGGRRGSTRRGDPTRLMPCSRRVGAGPALDRDAQRARRAPTAAPRPLLRARARSRPRHLDAPCNGCSLRAPRCTTRARFCVRGTTCGVGEASRDSKPRERSAVGRRADRRNPPAAALALEPIATAIAAPHRPALLASFFTWPLRGIDEAAASPPHAFIEAARAASWPSREGASCARQRGWRAREEVAVRRATPACCGRCA